VNLRAAIYFVVFGNIRLFGKVIRYRLPIRTLNRHYVLAPVLWNLNSVTSSDFGGKFLPKLGLFGISSSVSLVTFFY